MLATSCLSSTQLPEEDAVIANSDKQQVGNDVLSRLGHGENPKHKENTR
jgi:hypothetical protein